MRGPITEAHHLRGRIARLEGGIAKAHKLLEDVSGASPEDKRALRMACTELARTKGLSR